MSIDKLPIEEASDAQLRSFASDFLQLDLSKSCDTRAKLLAEIGKAWKQPFINVAVSDSPLQNDQAEAAKPQSKHIGILAKYKHDPLVELEIQSTSYPGGDQPAPVNVNGGNLLIPREVRVTIPYRFYLALKGSHEVGTTQDKDTFEFHHRKFTNYPMTVFKVPSEAEIAEWHKKTDHLRLGRHADKAQAKAA